VRTVSLVWPLSASAQRPSGSLTTPVGPLVHLVGRRLRDRTPKARSWPLQLGLVTSGVLVLASVPVLVGVGRRTQPGNASVLPGHYPLALAGVLTVVWLGVLAPGLWGVLRQAVPVGLVACSPW